MIRKVVYTSQGALIALDKELARGGEGSVHIVQKSNNHLLKLAHKPFTPDQQIKIREMVRLKSERIVKSPAWPVDTAHEKPNGDIIGFFMQKMSGKAIHLLYGPKSRMAEFPDADWRFLIHVASNVARCVNNVHQFDVIIGDINHGNMLVSPSGLVTLIDTDSFQICVGNQLMLCGVGIETHTPPELQGVDFRTTPRTRDHDNFGLAVIIFQLLFLGRHPFSGRYLNGQPSLEEALQQRLFAYGSDSRSRGVEPPPSTLPLEAVPTLMMLFQRAFLAKGSPRPTPTEWIDALEKLLQNLKVCVSHGGHRYPTSLQHCPWCEIEGLAKTSLFPFPSVVRQINLFDIETFWKQVTIIPVLASLGNLTLEPLPDVQISLWAQEQKQLYASGWKFLLAKIGLCEERRMAIESAKYRLETCQKEWSALEYRWSSEKSRELMLSLRHEIESLKSKFTETSKVRLQRLNKLQTDLQQGQLQRFLDKYRIHSANISGIGATRKNALLSYGIETAAHISEYGVSRVPGFGLTYTKKMMDWRKNIERQFVFNPKQGVDPRDIQQIERDMAHQQLQLELQMKEKFKQLEITYQIGTKMIATLRADAIKFRGQIAQATADLKYL